MTYADGQRDAEVAGLAGRQRTIVSHEQLIALGCGRRLIGRWVARGRLHVVFDGVYSVLAGELPPLAREQAALLACGERAFLSHETAAAIWGLVPVLPVEVEVTVVGRYRRSTHGLKVHRIRAIDRRDVRQHEGLWVSSPARALLEIAATRSLEELARALEDGLANRTLTRKDVDAVQARNRPCRGSGRVDALLASGGGSAITRSEAERRFKQLIRKAGLPLPETNVPLGRYEADFLWREERLVVEIDGYQFHSGPRSFYINREKDLVLRDAGLDVFRFTRDHVVYEPERVLARVVSELTRRRRDT
jgi:very-short-patch-repair endonuclease